jgi:hypothetical protein
VPRDRAYGYLIEDAPDARQQERKKTGVVEHSKRSTTPAYSLSSLPNTGLLFI